MEVNWGLKNVGKCAYATAETSSGLETNYTHLPTSKVNPGGKSIIWNGKVEPLLAKSNRFPVAYPPVPSYSGSQNGLSFQWRPPILALLWYINLHLPTFTFVYPHSVYPHLPTFTHNCLFGARLVGKQTFESGTCGSIC